MGLDENILCEQFLLDLKIDEETSSFGLCYTIQKSTLKIN
jgi:hypothetical protein